MEDTLSECCGCFLTYLDDGQGHWVLCCKGCHNEVHFDGSIK